MANSADPDQTAPQEQSDLGLHCICHIVRDFGVRNCSTFKLNKVMAQCMRTMHALSDQALYEYTDFQYAGMTCAAQVSQRMYQYFNIQHSLTNLADNAFMIISLFFFRDNKI